MNVGRIIIFVCVALVIIGAGTMILVPRFESINQMKQAQHDEALLKLQQAEAALFEAMENGPSEERPPHDFVVPAVVDTTLSHIGPAVGNEALRSIQSEETECPAVVVSTMTADRCDS